MSRGGGPLKSIVIVSGFPPSPTAERFVTESRRRGLAARYFFPESVCLGYSAPFQSPLCGPEPEIFLNRLLGVERPILHVLEVVAAVEASLAQDTKIVNAMVAVGPALSKRAQAALFCESGVSVPRTIGVGGSSFPSQIVQTVGLPVVLKTNFGMMGAGVQRFSSAEELGGFLERNPDFTGVAQSWLPEGVETLRALVVSGVVLASGLRRAAPQDWRANVAQGGAMSEEPLSPVESELAIRATESLGLDIGGVDIVRTRSGPVVLEINPSPGLAALESATSRNLVNEIMEQLGLG